MKSLILLLCIVFVYSDPIVIMGNGGYVVYIDNRLSNINLVVTDTHLSYTQTDYAGYYNLSKNQSTFTVEKVCGNGSASGTYRIDPKSCSHLCVPNGYFCSNIINNTFYCYIHVSDSTDDAFSCSNPSSSSSGGIPSWAQILIGLVCMVFLLTWIWVLSKKGCLKRARERRRCQCGHHRYNQLLVDNEQTNPV